VRVPSKQNGPIVKGEIEAP